MRNKNRNVAFVLSFCGSLSFVNFDMGATLSNLPFILFSLVIFCRPEFYRNKFRHIYVLVTILFSIIILISHSFVEVKDFLVFSLAIPICHYIAEKYDFRAKHIIIFVFFLLIPIGILHHFINGSEFYLFPDSNMQIIIIGPTKHITAYVGYLLLLSCCVMVFDKKFRVPITMYILLFFSLYIIFFSTARSYLLVALITLLLFFVNKNKMAPKWSSIIIIISIVYTFSMESLMVYSSVLNSNDIISKVSGVDNYERYGVTSGRSWLWIYHLDRFLESKNLMGGGRDVIDFKVGDVVGSTGEVAKAGSESFETSLLAEYGLIGILLIVFQFSLVLYTIYKRYAIPLCLFFSMLYITILGDNCISPLSYSSNIMLWVLFFKYIIDSDKNRIRIEKLNK